MNCKRILCSVLLFAFLFCMSACSDKPLEPQIQKVQSYTYYALDTECTITVYDTPQTDFGKIAEETTARYSDIFGTDSGAHIYQGQSGSVLQLDTDSYQMLKKGREVSLLSDGAFDITVGALTQLWDINNASRPPLDSDIQTQRETVGYEKLLFEDDTNQLSFTADQYLEVGGIAKGYIGQRVADALKNAGYPGGIVNLGGNITVFGRKADQAFTVGVRSPLQSDNSAGDIAGEITCTDTNIVTSGAYERYFMYEGKRYHHILDPKTGYPAVSDLISVTVVSPDGVYADALSTAVFVKGLDQSVFMLETAIENGWITGAVVIDHYCKVYVFGDISFRLTSSDFSQQY